MKIGDRLLEPRRTKHLSQEEVADRLNVTRQTVSKWETDQSMPDFDKIVPLCELYEISADELLTGNRCKDEKGKPNENVLEKRAKGIGIGILIYFLALAWIMITIPVMMMNPIISSAIFLVICGIATYKIVYTCMLYKVGKPKEERQPKLLKQIVTLIYLITLLVYLFISFFTMDWHITWILWIVAALLEEIIKLVFMLRGDSREK